MYSENSRGCFHEGSTEAQPPTLSSGRAQPCCQRQHKGSSWRRSTSTPLCHRGSRFPWSPPWAGNAAPECPRPEPQTGDPQWRYFGNSRGMQKLMIFLISCLNINIGINFDTCGQRWVNISDWFQKQTCKQEKSLSRCCPWRRKRSDYPPRRCRDSWWEHSGLSK